MFIEKILGTKIGAVKKHKTLSMLLCTSLEVMSVLAWSGYRQNPDIQALCKPQTGIVEKLEACYLIPAARQAEATTATTPILKDVYDFANRTLNSKNNLSVENNVNTQNQSELARQLGTWGPICDGNSTLNLVSDPTGQTHEFNVFRENSNTHYGENYKCDGNFISPISGKVLKATNTGKEQVVELIDDSGRFQIQFLRINPSSKLKYGDRISKGDVLGTGLREGYTHVSTLYLSSKNNPDNEKIVPISSMLKDPLKNRIEINPHIMPKDAEIVPDDYFAFLTQPEAPILSPVVTSSQGENQAPETNQTENISVINTSNSQWTIDPKEITSIFVKLGIDLPKKLIILIYSENNPPDGLPEQMKIWQAGTFPESSDPKVQSYKIYIRIDTFPKTSTNTSYSLIDAIAHELARHVADCGVRILNDGTCNKDNLVSPSFQNFCLALSKNDSDINECNTAVKNNY